MTYSRGNVFIKPHHREVTVIEEPSPHIRASPYHKPHHTSSHVSRGVFAKPHFGNPMGLPRVNPNPPKVPVLEKRKMVREQSYNRDVGKLQPAN